MAWGGARFSKGGKTWENDMGRRLNSVQAKPSPTKGCSLWSRHEKNRPFWQKQEKKGKNPLVSPAHEKDLCKKKKQAAWGVINGPRGDADDSNTRLKKSPASAGGGAGLTRENIDKRGGKSKRGENGGSRSEAQTEDSDRKEKEAFAWLSSEKTAAGKKRNEGR